MAIGDQTQRTADQIYPAWKLTDGKVICDKTFDDVCYLAGAQRILAAKDGDQWREVKILRWEFV